MALVWDMLCPSSINGVAFRANHKFVLIAYADHADHAGKNIWPAIKTISEKTGLDERTVQRMTHDLDSMGLLVDDGQGPRGTNKWSLPYNQRGDRLTPVRGDAVTPDTVPGDKNKKSLGDSPSGDSPSGDSVTPEFKNPEPYKSISIYYIDMWVKVLETLKDERPKAQFETWIDGTQPIGFDGDTHALTVATRNEYARQWLEDKITNRAQEISGVFVKFVVAEMADTE